MTNYVEPTDELTYKNYLNSDDYKPDQGIIDLTHTRINKTYGLLRTSTGTRQWFRSNSERVIYCTAVKKNSSNQYSAVSTLNDSSIWEVKPVSSWSSSASPYGYMKLMAASANQDWADFDLTGDATTVKNNFLTLAKKCFSAGDVVNSSEAGIGASIFLAFASAYLKKGLFTWVNFQKGVTNVGVMGGAENTGAVAPTPDTRHDVNLYSFLDDTNYGVGFGIENKNGNKFLKKYYKQIGIQNIYQFQEYSYYKKDDDTYYKNQDGWTVSTGTTGNKQFEPDLLWTRQERGEKRALNDTSNTNSTYVSYLMSQLKVDDGDRWTDYCQLGIPTWTTDIRCFDESCDREISSEITIPSDPLKFNIIGYYLDSSGAFKENSSCYITSGPIKYKSVSWKSNLIEPHDLCQERFTNVCGEPVYLGGGVPLCQTPTETTGSKVKLHYKVTKLDGTPIDSAAGDIPIKITLSNKQFVNGNLASGAANRGELTTTVNSSSPEGDWTSNAFQMAAKEKLWLNAYASTKGYNVVISNIDVS